MERNQIQELMKLSTDKQKYISGLAMYKNEMVSNEYAKVEGNRILFYGTVQDESHRQSYTAMMSLDTQRRMILESSCDCQNILGEHLRKTKVALCPHIVAAVFKGLQYLKRDDLDEAYQEGQIIVPEVSVSLNGNRAGLVKMDFAIKGIDKSEYRKIYTAFKEQKKLYNLGNGDRLDLGEEKLQATFQLIDILGLYNEIENIKIPANKMLYLENLLEEGHLDFIDGSQYITNVVNKFKKGMTLGSMLPNGLEATLRTYQVEGYQFLETLAHYEFGGILADEMGLGKTVQMITFLLAKPGTKRIVITPTALIYNWKSEIEKFAPTLKVGIVHGAKTERHKVLANSTAYDVLLTTYTTFKNDYEQYQKMTFDYCIIDEAQQIKNPDAAITQAIKQVQAKVKFALTGTPIENNLLELWSIFDFVMPGYLYNALRFKNIFMQDTRNLNELKKLIKPFMLRRTKKEVVSELPDKIEQKLVVELGSEHQRVYAGYLKLLQQKLQEENTQSVTMFSHLTKLRQLCLAPELLVKNYKGSNSKLEALMELISTYGDRKILIFSQFTKVLGLISERLEESGIQYSYLDGSTPAQKRLQLVEAFNASQEQQVFLISLKAGGTGLNLTSASIVIHFDPWWNPAVQNQASDRAHRLGQQNEVNVIHLVAKGTVEEKVVLLQESKKELIEEMIEGNLESTNLFQKLSQEELLELFR